MPSKHAIHCFLALTVVLSLTSCWQIVKPEHKEAVLKEDLYTLRNAIDQFTQDKGSAPQTLDDLVRAGYLRELPIDPIPGSRTTWHVVTEDLDETSDGTLRGITDVHSGSHAISSNGTPYDSW